MPDITVQFEFGSEGSLSKSVTGIINAEIGKIQSGILDQPLMLKLDIDPNSLSSIESKIADLFNKYGSTFASTGAGGVGAAASRNIAKSLQESETAIQKLINLEVGLYNKPKSAEKSFYDFERLHFTERINAEKELQKEKEKTAKQAEKVAQQEERQRQQDEKASQRALEKAQKDAESVARIKSRQLENIRNAEAKIAEAQGKFKPNNDNRSKLDELKEISGQLKNLRGIFDDTSNVLDLDQANQCADSVGRITTKITALKTELETLSKSSRDNFLTNPAAQGNAQAEINRKLSSAQTYLKNYTAAAKSSNPEVRQAYENIGSLVQEYQDLSTKVRDGSISTDKFKEEIAGLNADLTKNNRIIKDSGSAHKTLIGTLTTSMSKFAQYFTSTRVVMGAYRAMQQMVKESIAVNDAMTQLQIVTKSSNSEMAAYSKTAFESAKRLGSSVTDVVSATTTYARLGYTIKESGTLAELTTMLQGVGDIDAQSAQSAVTAIIKAFDGIDISNIETVMDKLVAVGNGAPISVSELAEGLNNASSALSAAGNSFDQSVALLTSANTTIQNAAQSSTGLRTIAARIRNTKTELDELGETLTSAEYQNIVDALTNVTKADGTKAPVSLTNANGELRSTYDIIKDIAEVWQYMDANQQAALAETLAGTRQQNIFYSLVENFEEASKAMGLMEDSAGAMQSAYDIFLTSTTAHINQFKAAFSELATDVVDSGIMNFFIDLGRVAIEVIDKIVAFANKGGIFGQGGLVVGIFGIANVIKSIS